MCVDVHGCRFFFFPGKPLNMEDMFSHSGVALHVHVSVFVCVVEGNT